MAGPFRFFKPSDADQTGYDPGVNRQTLGVQRVSEVALFGEGSAALVVRPNDSSVVDIAEPASASTSERRFRLTGTKEGDAMLEAKERSGAVVAFMQVHVAKPPPSLGPPISAGTRTDGNSKTKVHAALRTSPFPVAYGTFSADPGLQAALDDAMRTEPAHYKAMTTAIVALNPDGTRPFAQHRGNELHYGASLLKVAAMYAGFELRATLGSIADELGGAVRQSDVLKTASAYLDPQIMAKVATIPAIAHISPGFALPRYASAFDVVSKSGAPGFEVNFSASYVADLKEMIGPSHNLQASICVHRVGYGYLNGALGSAGFFDSATQKGLWLAGDYQESPNGKYPAFRIPDCVNDGDTAQGATANQIARMMALLWDKQLVGPDASTKMLELMTGAPAGERYSELGASANFEISNVKIGYGPLSPTHGGYPVMSEASIVKHTASGRMFAVGWLNLPDRWESNRSEPIAARLAKTFDAYVRARP